MEYSFDIVHDRSSTDSIKWRRYGPGVIPFWVADMDFPSPDSVIRALAKRAAEKIYGYPETSVELRSLFCTRLAAKYGWQTVPEEIFFLAGLVSGINFTCHAFTKPGEAVIAQPPVYHHFLTDPAAQGRAVCTAPLLNAAGEYEIDFEAFEAAITPRTRLFILCNPHNPVGRVFRKDELEQLAEICLRRRLIICSDEIHCDLIYRGREHIPMASLAPEIAASTVTLMSPSKTYNLAGLGFAFAVIKDAVLQKRWKEATSGLNPMPDIFGQTAAQAAYAEGDDWLTQVLSYLEGNRDFIADYIGRCTMPLSMSKVEGTYLAWLDCRSAGIAGSPGQFFLEKAQTALMDGSIFGPGGEGFVRLNFACPRKTLAEGLERMRAALEIGPLG